MNIAEQVYLDQSDHANQRFSQSTRTVSALGPVTLPGSRTELFATTTSIPGRDARASVGSHSATHARRHRAARRDQFDRVLLAILREEIGPIAATTAPEMAAVNDGAKIAADANNAAVNGETSSCDSTVASTQSANCCKSMSRQSQLVVVAASTIVFAGLLVYLSEVLLPLVAISAACVAMQYGGAIEPRDSRIWQSVQTRLDQWRSMLGGTSDVSAEKNALSTDAAEDLDIAATKVPLSQASQLPSDASASPGKRCSRVITVKNSKHTPASLRVTNVGVTSDGLPSALPDDSQDVLDYIVEPNSIEPYEFENEFMKGRLLFLLQRSDSPLPAKYKELFEGKRRLFWVQLQVQFKKVPSGILYIGGEVPRSMNLGFFTGGLTKIILSVLQSLVRGIHCTFGQIFPTAAKTQEEEELPHICFPLYTAVDQFVVTPPGGTPPALGSADFGESKESMAARRKSGLPMFQYNTIDTYSFHFHSFFIDFARWRLNGLPGMKDTELSTFWDDMPLRLCAYSLKPQPGVDPNSEAEAKKAVHSWNAKEYKFCFQLSHKVQDEYKIVDDVEEDDGPMMSTSTDRSLSDVETQEAELRAELARYEFSIPTWFEYFSSSPAHSERRVGYAIRVQRKDSAADISDGNVTKSYHVLLTAVAAFSPLAFVEHDVTYTVRRGSGRSGVFHNSKSKTLEESISVKSRMSRYAKIEDERQFLEHHLLYVQNPTGAITKITAAQMVQAQMVLLEILQGRSSALGVEWPFLASAYALGTSFGSSISAIPDVESASVSRDPVPATSQIVRAITPTCWRNEWVTIDRAQRSLRFFRMLSSSPACVVSLDSILMLEEAVVVEDVFDSDDDDTVDLYWLRVVTIERCHHLAFASIEDRSQWLDLIRAAVELGGNSMESLLKQPVFLSCQRVEMDSFITGTSTKSRGAKRSVLNDRCDYFSPDDQPHTAGRFDASDPNEVVSKALKQAIKLQQDRLQDYSTRELVCFLDVVGLLKWANLDRLKYDEQERKVFLLNLYHLMLMHSSILGFLPKSKTQWSKFFNGVSYNIGGTHLSIAEVEHGLIRAPMAHLKLAIALLVIPKVTDADDRAPLRLTVGDFRVNFALNCLTKSCSNSIMVFTTEHLERQLDRMTAITAEYTVAYDRESKIVYMPKVCEWYRADFTTDLTSRWQQSCLLLLRKYMDGSKAQLVDYLLQHEQTLVTKWKFAKYDYRFHESIQEASVDETNEN